MESEGSRLVGMVVWVVSRWWWTAGSGLSEQGLSDTDLSVVIVLENFFGLYFTVFCCSIACVVPVMGVMVGFPVLVDICL